MYMMRHIQRALPNKRGDNAKCFHRTAHVTLVHNHFPLRCTYSKAGSYHSCSGEDIPHNRALLYHYRRERGPPESCHNRPEKNSPGLNLTSISQAKEAYECTIVRDVNAWRYLDALKEQVRAKLLDIFNDGRFTNLS